MKTDYLASHRARLNPRALGNTLLVAAWIATCPPQLIGQDRPKFEPN